jgi:hypothetical protein
MVSYVDETAGKWTLGRIPSLLVHAYLSEALGSVAPHEWFTIGLSGFYSGAPTGTYGGLHPSRNRDFDATLREARAGGTLVPLEQFLRYGRTQFLGPDILRNYAQAWSFVWFLKRQQAPEWKGVLSTYYEALRSGVRDRPARLEFQGDARSVASEEEELIRESAWKAVFGGFDGDTWERLEQAWLDFK